MGGAEAAKQRGEDIGEGKGENADSLLTRPKQKQIDQVLEPLFKDRIILQRVSKIVS